MATDKLIVFLEGNPIGVVERTTNGALRLRYDESYRGSPTSTLLSVSMPPDEEVHGDAHLRPWLWGPAAGQRRRACPVGKRFWCVSGVAVPVARHPGWP